MKSTLHIQDLTLSRKIDHSAMSAIRGGTGDQANATQQSNVGALMAPVHVGNGSIFGGGPMTFQVTSNPNQWLDNTSTSTNAKALSLIPGLGLGD